MFHFQVLAEQNALQRDERQKREIGGGDYLCYYYVNYMFSYANSLDSRDTICFGKLCHYYLKGDMKPEYQHGTVFYLFAHERLMNQYLCNHIFLENSYTRWIILGNM